MLLSFLLLLIGLAILVAGAELLVRGASGIARTAGLSPLVIGLTVVAFGTSSPELAVSLGAAFQGNDGIVAGNIVGSNLFNAAFILGLSALVFPLQAHLQLIRLDLPVMLLASGLFVVFLLTGERIDRWEAGILFVAAVAYTIFIIRLSRQQPPDVAESVTLPGIPAEPPKKPWIQWLLAAAGLGLLVGGTHLFVGNATAIARELDVSEAIIGLTLVAAGTSLPELATSVVAAFRRETDMAIGNIVGSNLFNVLAIGGIAGLASPIDTASVAGLDLAFMLGASLLLLPLMRTGFRIVRWEGAVLVAVYLGYIFLRWP